MNDRLASCVQDYFLGYLIGRRGYGANTVGSYMATFKLLYAYMREIGLAPSKAGIGDLTRDVVSGFLAWLASGRGCAPSTCNVRLAHIKSFASFTAAEHPELSGYCAAISSVSPSKAALKPPECCSREEVEALLAAPDASGKDGLRHLAIMALLYDSACRVQELIDLDVSDVVLGRLPKACVTGKGGKYREVPILRRTADIISAYIESYPVLQGPLFFNARGERLTRQGVRWILMKYAGEAREADPALFRHGISPHRLRHSKATHLIESKVNIFHVRDFLGHSSIRTTQVYLTSNPEVTREAVEEAASDLLPGGAAFTEEVREDLLAFLDGML